ncbi:MAG: DinB family protein [Ferruginibacter sp.]
MDKLINDIDAVTAEFIQYFGSLSAQQLNYKRECSQWSIAQNISHIITVNDSYKPLIQSVKNHTYKTAWYSKFKFLVNYFGIKVQEMVKPHMGGKIKTVKQWEPEAEKARHDVVTDFAMHQHTLKQLILSSKDLMQQVIHSPASKLVVYRLEDAFKIIVAHEQRHLEQAKSMLVMQYSERLGF